MPPPYPVNPENGRPIQGSDESRTAYGARVLEWENEQAAKGPGGNKGPTAAPGYVPAGEKVTDNRYVEMGKGPDGTNVVHEKQPDGSWRTTYTSVESRGGSSGGGGGGADKNYTASNIAERKAAFLATGRYFENLPQNFHQIPGTNKAAGPGGTGMVQDTQTGLWSVSFLTKDEAAASLRSGVGAAPGAPGATGAPLSYGGGGAGVGLQGNGPLPPPGTGALLPGTAGMPGTLPASAGVTVPGMGAFNLPGLGIEAEGRRTLYDNNGLNTMFAGSPNGPQIQAGPGMRNGRFGNNIQFGGSGGTTSIKPQMEFAPASVSVPGSYQQGVGNVGPMGGIMPFSAPFNIGAGGAGLMNIGGSNVQLNSADKSFGMGFAMTPQTPSDKFAATDFGSATGRSLNPDPALQSAQILQLMAAINSMGGGGGAIDALTAAERNQYSGNPPTSQGTWFSGAAPGPQMSPYQPSAPAPAPSPTAGMGPVGATVSPTGNPLLDAVTAPPASNAAAIAAAMAEEEEQGGGVRGYSRGGTVNTLPGFSAGGVVGIGRSGPLSFASGGRVDAMGPIGSVLPPTDAAPAVDPALGGSLATPGAGAAVQNQAPTAATNPADNAIQPVQGPQNTTSVINNNAWSVPATAQSQAQAPAAAAAPDPLAAFRAAQQKQAMQERARTQTFSNRWKAAGLEPPTAIQLGPGEQPREGFLPPGQYYSISDALKMYMDQIMGRQTTLAGLGTIGDPAQLLADMTRYEVEQAPYKQALDIGTQLAGLGAGGTANLEGLAQQQALLKEQMGPLAEVSDLNARLRGLGSPFSQEAVEAQSLKIQGLEDQIREYNSALGEGTGGYEGILGPNPYADELIRAQKVLDSERNTLSQMFSRNNEISQTTTNLNSFMQSLGISDINQLDESLGSYAAQQDALKQAYNSALQGETYRNQIASLTGGKSATDEMARYQQLINQSKIGYGNVETAQRLNNEINALAQKGATLPGFAKGGSWIAGVTKNAHGQFRAKAQAAGMSTKAYASKMADAPGRTGKQARLAKTLMGFAGGGQFETKRRPSRSEEMLENLGAPPNSGRIMSWYPGYADGGSMTADEPIIGMGMYSGQPRFQVGEPQYPGGPPMAERLEITPLNRPSKLPMGRLSSAA